MTNNQVNIYISKGAFAIRLLNPIFKLSRIGFFLTCTTDSEDETVVSSDIKAARELVYLNRLEDAEAILLQETVKQE